MHTREIIGSGELPRIHLDGEIAGDWCWLPFRGIDEQTLFGWLETADMRLDTRWTASLIREELQRRRGVKVWLEGVFAGGSMQGMPAPFPLYEETP